MRKRKRPSRPSDALRQAWRQLRGHGCLLCRQAATVGGLYVPGPTAPAGLPPGRALAYLLCGQCYALPHDTVTARVEAWVVADLRRQQAWLN